MYPFEKYRVLIFQKVPDQFFGYPAPYDIGFHAQMGHDTCIPGIIIHAGTKRFKSFIRFAVILKAMKMNADAGFGEGFDLVKYIDHSSVIGRPWDVERDDMQMLIHCFYNFGWVFLAYCRHLSGAPETNPVTWL
jgi:hypothetical protein